MFGVIWDCNPGAELYCVQLREGALKMLNAALSVRARDRARTIAYFLMEDR